MARFDNLNDYCLLTVLDRLLPHQLFTMLGVNKRLNQLATDKIQNKIKATSFARDFNSAECSHLDTITQDQVLILEPLFKHIFEALQDPSEKTLFLDVLAKCTDVKCIDFSDCELPKGVLLEVFQRCPQLECIKLGASAVEKDEWDQVLEEIGSRIVHLAKDWVFDETSLSKAWLLKAIATKCPNLKQLDWVMDENPTNDLVAAFKMLKKSCWVTLKCETLAKQIVENVDELVVTKLNWFLLGNRVNRLSSLKLTVLPPQESPFQSVEFAALKKLDFGDWQKGDCHENRHVANCLIASRFPCLEEFSFRVCYCLSEEHYDSLFRAMPAVKKLVLSCGEHWLDVFPRLPRTAIYKLEQLDTFHLNIWYPTRNWKSKDFLQPIEQYVDGVISLEKLSVDMWIRKFNQCNEWKKAVTDGVKRMKEKQNRVDLVLKTRYC